MAMHGQEPSSATEGDVAAIAANKSTFWDASEVSEGDFRKITNRKVSDTFSPNESQISTWVDAPNQETHASFGDSGVTATVNACGDLMQFSSYLDAGNSGIFCADHRTTNEPYSVQERADDLLFLSRDKSRQRCTYGLRVLGVNMKNCRHLGYVHDRWPRYEVKDKNLKLTIQWMVREKVVLQQCVITNTGNTDVDVSMEFWKDLHIRDMDYLSPMRKFNDDWNGHVPVHGPGNYGWILGHPLKQKGPTEDKRPGKDQSPGQLLRQASRKPTNNTIDSSKGGTMGYSKDLKVSWAETDFNNDTVAVVMSMFVDGKAIRFESSDQNRPEKVIRKIEYGTAIEVVSAYKMIQWTESEAVWRDFMVPADVTDVSKHLAFASKFFEAFYPCYHDVVNKVHGKSEEGVREQEIREWASLMPPKSPTGSLEDGDQVKRSINHIDFVARRKLEDILSVCAIPLRDPEMEGDVVPIALTCGDLSGHRVSSPASFFAFSFLIEISKRLSAASSNDQTHAFGLLQRRIDSVCRGHLMWLDSEVDKTDSGCFSANYWVKGNLMPHNEASESFMPIDSLTDTPFQIIKVFDFSSQYQSEEDSELVRTIINEVAKPWIRSLDKTDRRGVHAWPHSQDEGCNKYRLSEHVWVWRALKLLEDHFRDFPSDDDEELGVPHSNLERGRESRDVITSQHDQRFTDKKLLRRFDSRDVQRDILRRFTAENEMSKKRMLAMTRSPRETRFLFHASDTALFYGINRDFFLEKTSFNEVWENTIEAQVHHNENSETGWDNSIRYALAIMLGTRNMSINKRTPQELIKSSLKVLFGSTAPNGLFYGLLDSTTKETTLFGRENDRDFYFHATFEIPYILLTHCWKIHSKLNISDKRPEDPSLPQPNTSTTHNPMEEVVDLTLMQPKRQPAQSERKPIVPVLSASSSAMTESQLGSTAPQKGVKLKATKAISMKKSIPFNSLIDQSSIVDLEEEWLYNYPAFFNTERQTSDQFNDEAERLLDHAEMDTSGALISRAAEEYTRSLRTAVLRKREEAAERRTEDPLHLLNRSWTDILPPDEPNALEDDSDKMAFVADVMRQRTLQKHERENNVTFRGVNSNYKLWYLLSLPRTASKAKKRFIWLPSANNERALVCYLASPPDERQAIALFFERHYQYEKHFLDETSMVLNTWESELHLSFYKLVDEDYKHADGIPKGDVDEFPGRDPKRLLKASVGFRFIGDFFDRHWTCHLIEHIPGGKPVPTWWDRDLRERDFPWGDKYKGQLVQEDGSWRQRKVLELHLFDRILEEIVDSTKMIYDTVKGELGVENVAIPFSVLNSEDYFSSSEQWQRFQQILQVLEEDLSDMRVIISKWETREKDRGQERPRWTRTDERKYRRYIGKLEGTTRRRIRDLQRLHVQIQSLKETLRRGQQQIRDDLNLRGSENIRFFTYVTVVFLPLGFASSIFGMSEEPPSSVIPPMLICSVVALLVTIIALANAKRLNGVVEIVSKGINSYSLMKMERSRLLNRHRRASVKTQNLSRQAEEAASETSEGHFKGTNVQANRGIRAHEDDQSWHFWFWVGYVFIELPARRVLMAYYDLKHPRILQGSMYFRMTVGILLLPIFLVSFLFQLVLINTFDTVRSILSRVDCLKTTMNSTHGEQDENAKFVENHLDWLAYPMKRYRPYRSKSDTSEGPSDQKDAQQGSNGDRTSHYSGK
ncbi:hypothetical protein CKAH01_13616 [Colletotrichum kahawae]|uniref:Uncharacterized protein n=1 Tax=Colletotrichum kahawae TaxID=34407 RepID=A0AAE0DDP5_COLKA|nr:hypothetical protein CKAH01_13616 [Colletotrichum kahawae]